ncbi:MULTISPECIES: peptidylprolyl isomerase [Ramlibacter]|uniref:peptidylprolyl isomerase n=1 Tax=Ramlibacter pinisoli TaxID=2682844 RepID=A0A6N8J166_9BURK|nr:MULTISPECIES: peptidylprolyl isomerase [Ramlibacter]MBA2962070.1 peptidylprolyl isomerase [Ramlibacter sp. CGMCC 1.13660]MVQ32013.1 peptidylprolyl isomerase [Ramlibacter pinisoli]
MTTILKIDGQAISDAELLQTLKLTGQFQQLVEQFTSDRITVLAARKQGLRVSDEEIQERADQFRRVRGLHRASDTNKYLDARGIGLEEFQAFITDSLYREKMMERVCSDEAVRGFFKLNSPRFDSIEVSHIVVDSEGKAKEVVSVLRDDPDSFEEMAREHSIADTRERGGLIGKVLRGALRGEVEAKVFNAAAGEVLGPFASSDGTTFEVFRVNTKHPASLDDDTATEVRRQLRQDWLRARAQEHIVEAC